MGAVEHWDRSLYAQLFLTQPQQCLVSSLTSSSESLTLDIGSCHTQGLGAGSGLAHSYWLASQLFPCLGKEETPGSKIQEGTFRLEETTCQKGGWNMTLRSGQSSQVFPYGKIPTV